MRTRHLPRRSDRARRQPQSQRPRASAPPHPSASSRHEAQPRRVLHPARGLRQAHPDVPEDARRQAASASSQSYGASGEQARAVKAGLDADIVALSLAPDMDELVAGGQGRREVEEAVRTGDGHELASSSSSFATATRRRSRAGTTSLRPGVEIVTPNPFTLGRRALEHHGRLRRRGGSRARPTSRPRRTSCKLCKNVVVQDTSARDALSTFNSGKGDVLLAYENEAYFARTQGLNLQCVIPKIDDPDREPDRGHEGQRGQGRRRTASSASCARRPRSRSSPTTATGPS